MADKENPRLNESDSGEQETPHGDQPAFPVSCPGLTTGHTRLKDLGEIISKGICAREFKVGTSALWTVIAGGTGTGKSTIFNALCGERLSAAGVERPKTAGPVAFAHESFSVSSDAACILPPVQRISCRGTRRAPTAGTPDRLTVLTHSRDDLRHVVLVDTPDLDSVDHAGKDITGDLAMPADFVIFVASQEKYADRAPGVFLSQVVGGGTPCLFVLNKAAPETGREEIRKTLDSHGIPMPAERIAIIPYGVPPEGVPEDRFERLAGIFFDECAPPHVETLRRLSIGRLDRLLAASARESLKIIDGEADESAAWLEKLSALHSRSCEEFLRLEEARLTTERTRHLRAEVRKLFSRYDVLAGPRRLIRAVLVFPLRLIGIKPAPGIRDRKEDLASLRGRLNLAPLFASLENFNRGVLEGLSPSDPSAPLYSCLRGEIAVSESDAVEMVSGAQAELEDWLASTFEDMERRLPRSKKWGIYTTAVMWGILVVSLEAALGGGFTVIDAAVGSALAPFATKGALELFALREIQRIARELSLRLRKGLLSVLDEQKARYEHCLMSVMPRPETVALLKHLAAGPAGAARCGDVPPETESRSVNWPV